MKRLSLAGALLLAAAGPGSPAAPIAQLNAALTQTEKNAGQPFQARYDALAPAIDAAFDLPQLLQKIVGLKWSQIPAPQQQKLLIAFRAFTIASYAGNFDTDAGDAFQILPETRSVGADQVVETQIAPKSGDPVRIDYLMRQEGSGWRVVDVLQQGTISQVAVQRSDFRSLLDDASGQKLIDSLNARANKLAHGTLRP